MQSRFAFCFADTAPGQGGYAPQSTRTRTRGANSEAAAAAAAAATATDGTSFDHFDDGLDSDISSVCVPFIYANDAWFIPRSLLQNCSTTRNFTTKKKISL